MKREGLVIATLLLVMAPLATSASNRKSLGEIDFFGYKGLGNSRLPKIAVTLRKKWIRCG